MSVKHNISTIVLLFLLVVPLYGGGPAERSATSARGGFGETGRGLSTGS